MMKKTEPLKASIYKCMKSKYYVLLCYICIVFWCLINLNGSFAQLEEVIDLKVKDHALEYVD